jgi:hypothetical protein
MLSFRDYLVEQQALEEKLVTFGGKAYPKFGHMVIMAGGAASGKGFVRDKLLGIEGAVYDVDHLKKMVAKTDDLSKHIKDVSGYDVKALYSNLKNQDNVRHLHAAVKSLHVDDRKLARLMNSVFLAPADRIPNIIFDVTLKDMKKFYELTGFIDTTLPYSRRNVHLVWVITSFEVAKKLNAKRDRVVPDDIMVETHTGASATMAQLMKMSDQIQRHLDGDVVFVFNTKKVDSKYIEREEGDSRRNTPAEFGGKYKGGFFDKKQDAFYIYVKRQGEKMMSMNDLSKELTAKIIAYTPSGDKWR